VVQGSRMFCTGSQAQGKALHEATYKFGRVIKQVMKPGCTTRSNANGSHILFMVVVCNQIQCTIIIAGSEAGSEDGRWMELAQDRV
jgi:hypothetical protein